MIYFLHCHSAIKDDQYKTEKVNNLGHYLRRVEELKLENYCGFSLDARWTNLSELRSLTGI